MGWDRSRLIGAMYSRVGTRGGKQRCGEKKNSQSAETSSIDQFFLVCTLSSSMVPLFLPARWDQYQRYGKFNLGENCFQKFSIFIV